MGWGNGIGIGWPNASASAGPPIPKESYDIYNCVASENNNTNPYPVGSFFVGDRVLINGGGSYGYIQSTIESTPGGYSLTSLPFGYGYERCNDSTVALTSDLIPTPDELYKYSIVLNGTENFEEDIPVISNEFLDYEITVRLHYEASFNGGALIKTGYVDIVTNTYNIPGGETATIATVFAFNVLPEELTLDYYNYYMDPLTIKNTYGPYNTGWDYLNKFVTDNGNIWTFYWPTEF